MIPANLNKPILRQIWGRIYRDQSNCFIGITGRVNTGKSETGGRIAYEFEGKKFIMEKHIVYTVNDLINVALSVVHVKGKPLDMEKIEQMSMDDVEKWMMDNIDTITIKPGLVIVFDEAGTEVYIREFLSKDNKTISKLVQIWRFLRLIVIIIVPENINILESTISRFMDFEILMLGVNKRRGTAKAICYEYIGWNKRKREPYKRRINGCRNIGYLEISHWGKKLSKKYRKVSEIKKVRAIMRFKKGKKPIKEEKEANAHCNKCDYKWFYSGKMKRARCPSCHGVVAITPL